MESRKVLLKTILVFLVALGTRNSKGNSVTINDYKPSWSIGQTWKVEVQKYTEPPSLPRELIADFKARIYKIVYELTVEDINKIDKELCYQIRIECVSVDGIDVSKGRIFHRAFMRQSDCTLKAIERISRKNNQIEVTHSFSRGPIVATDLVWILPMEFPFFDPNALDYEPPKKVVSKEVVHTKMHHAFQKCRSAEKTINNKKQTVLNIILEEKHGISRRTSQIWVKGLPWWLEAIHKREGEEWCTAKLIMVNGKKITDKQTQR